MQEHATLMKIGLIVPPANSTVEPEMAALIGPNAAIYATRLPGMVEADTGHGLDNRIEGYLSALPDVARSFGGMSLDALCLMHTGCSYVVGLDGEPGLREALGSSGAPNTLTAAGAIAETLTALDCKRIALVSPYPDWLTKGAISYWETRGLAVIDVAKPRDVVSIYEITPQDVLESIGRLDTRTADAIVLSGTGMATLHALESYAPTSDIPVVSSNLCSAWQALSQSITAGVELQELVLPMQDLRDRLTRVSGSA